MRNRGCYVVIFPLFLISWSFSALERNVEGAVAGTLIYQTDNTPGLRVYNGSNWMRFTETAD